MRYRVEWTAFGSNGRPVDGGIEIVDGFDRIRETVSGLTGHAVQDIRIDSAVRL